MAYQERQRSNMSFRSSLSTLLLLACVAAPNVVVVDANLRATVEAQQRQQKQRVLASYNDGPKVSIGSGKLGHCQGDCDSDSDCQRGLVCDNTRQQGVPRPVPGCSISPTETTGTDFCVRPEDLNDEDSSDGTTGSTTGGKPSGGKPSGGKPSGGKPSGGKPSGGKPSGGDGGSGRSIGYYRSDNNNDDGSAGLNYDDVSGGPLQFVGDDPDTLQANSHLGKCVGDCDSDYDCGQGLMCWQRDGSEKIPGCAIGGPGDIAGTDYCVDEKYRYTDGDQYYGPNDPTFRLKLYWEPGYTWQGERFERRWCIECINGSCSPGELIYISECSITRNDLLEFVQVSGQYYQVKLLGFDLCFERNGNAMAWQGCNSSNQSQHWYAGQRGGSGSFTDAQFEIRPRGSDDKCATQQHHPKDEEWLELEDCSRARGDQTALWMKY